jgi:glycosyltransferase involved in cell wall biosynthesis
MKLTVLVISYNHEPFICQALDSVLAQQTDFDFEILICEDCSTDATRQIVQQYAEAHPGKIRLLLSEQNMHSPLLIEHALEAARGEYIAFLDGDDYWTSPEKLQKQIAFMERHPGCVFSWHPIDVVDVNGDPLGVFRNPHSRTAHTIEDFLARYPEPAGGSVIIRNSIPEIPHWYRSCPAGDYPLWIIALQYGTAEYLDEVLSVYRIHAGGYWSGRDEVRRREFSLSCYRALHQNLGAKYWDSMRKTLAESWWTLAASQLLAGQKEASRSTAREGLKECPRVPRLLILAYAPWAWTPLRVLYRIARRLTGRYRAERQAA